MQHKDLFLYYITLIFNPLFLINNSISYGSNGYTAAFERALEVSDICSKDLTENEKFYSTSLQQIQSFVSETEYSIAYYPIADDQLKILAEGFSIAKIAKEVEALFSFTTIALNLSFGNK